MRDIPIVKATVTVNATRGTLPITAEIHCSLDSEEQFKTITINELNKNYPVDFIFEVTESGTYTAKAWAVLSNVVDKVTIGPVQDTVHVEIPFMIRVRAYADTTEVGVPVTGLYPSGSWTTPFSIKVTEEFKDKVLSFKFPQTIYYGGQKYGITSVSNGYISSIEGGYAIVNVLADIAKEVSVYYTKQAAKWVFDQGRYGKIYVWDCWYERTTKTVYVDITVVPGTTGTDYDLTSATIVAKDSPYHGFIYASGIVGHKLVKFTIKYDWYIDYGVEIDANWRYGGSTVAITIRRSGIREV